ncbi:Heavy-metal resistance [Monaibacterium marinum]|uniref:Heavy-metal resistance n=1 Tax=Pontivivens marinum TaxID=1690039 RepID=A0A2C9CM90_9RHOB|nr:periplasmic heavy metal sensor [Monaibacterium marinum]SOH92327.1 Heavy-metal resistance [Monaibacterium marinum]
MSTAPKKRRAITIALILSLGLNFVIVGVVAGAFLRGDKSPVRIAVTPDLRAAISALPEEGRDQIREAMRNSVPDPQSARIRQLNNSRTFATAIRSDPMDRELVEAMFNQRMDADSTLRASAQSALLDALEAMTQQQRVDFLNALREESRSSRGDSDRGGPDSHNADGTRPRPDSERPPRE